MRGLLRFLGGLSAVGLLASALLLLAVWAGQRELLYVPDANPLKQGEALGAQTLQLPTRDGERLVAWWLPPPDARAAVVLYLHGNGANLDARAGRLQALREDGVGVLALSWRGYGGSSGQPSEAGWARDADAAYAWLRAQGIAPQRVVLFGESLGTTQAVMLAGRVPVAALLLDSGFDSVRALARSLYPFLPVDLLLRDPHRADLVAPTLRLPVLQVHCARDRVVPLARAQALNRLFTPPAALRVIDDACHVPRYLQYREDARRLFQQIRDRAS